MFQKLRYVVRMRRWGHFFNRYVMRLSALRCELTGLKALQVVQMVVDVVYLVLKQTRVPLLST